MTRLESSSEPSMEEILASIRKIIAEDPPENRGLSGSHARSFAQPKPLLDRAMFLRDAQGRSETSLNATAENDHGLTQQNDENAISSATAHIEQSKQYATTSFASARSSDADTLADVRRPMTHHDNMASSVSSTYPSGDDSRSPAARIEAQISDLLADEIFDPVEADADTRETQLKSDHAIDGNQHIADAGQLLTELSNVSSSLAATLDRSVSDDPSPRFTVTRDGYVPDASGSTQDDEHMSPAHDPFKLDLGVSPFAQRTPQRISQPNSEAPFADLGRNAFRRRDVLEPVSTFEPQETLSPYASPSDVEEEPAEFADNSYADTTQPASEPNFATPPIVAAPNVSATLPPSASFADLSRERTTTYRKTETPSFVSGISDAVMAETATSRPSAQYVAVQVLENPVMLEVMDSPQPVHPMTVRDQSDVNSAPLTTTANANVPRSMEDTVADLLRPLLKVWLAENMPKIIERALLREISDITKSEHKAAAE